MMIPLREGLGKLRRSEYFRHVATLFSGSAAASVISVLVAPVLSRIYTPTDYGLLGMYMAASAVIGTFATLQFDHAIVTEEDEARATHSAAISFVTTFLVSAFLLIAVFLATLLFTPAALDASLSPWFLFLPLSTLAGGLGLTAAGLATRAREYRAISATRIASALISPTVAISLGLAGFGAKGLFLSFLAAQVLAALVLCVHQRKRIAATVRDTGRVALVAQIRKSHRFPLFTLPATLINTISQQVPIWLLTMTGVPSNVGHFTRARQLVSLPFNLIGGSIAQVFKQRASAERAKTGNCSQTFRHTARFLLVSGFPPLLALFLFAPTLFAFILGEPWREAGEFARILSPMFLLRYVASPVSVVFYIADRQREDLLLHILLIALTSGGPIIVYSMTDSVRLLLVTLSVSYSIIYLTYFLRSKTLAQFKHA